MSAGVLDCVNALQAVLESIDGLNNKVLFAYNEDDFLDKIKGIRNYPGAGIIYEGIHSMPEQTPSGRVGVSGQLVVSIVLIETGDTLRSTNQAKTVLLGMLDTIRNNLVATKSPTGHFWRFLVEAQAVLKSGMCFWLQRYSTPIQVIGTNPKNPIPNQP